MENNVYYTPNESSVTIEDTMNLSEYLKWEEKIDCDTSLNSRQKQLLKLLATRQIEFNFNKIADYYSDAPRNIKNYLEDLKLVIVDTDRAIEKGYFKYFEDYQKLIEGLVNEK